MASIDNPRQDMPLRLLPENTWQQELQQLVREPKELLELLDLPMALLPEAEIAADLFPLRVPRSFVHKMRAGDVDDPLLKQVLPLGVEALAVDGFVLDPLEEMKSNPHKGLIHKYQGRVLLMAAPSCAINCRYCFRRHFPYQENQPSRNEWLSVLDYVRKDTSLNEVILSGGDPLMTSDKQLRWLVGQVSDIPHIKRLRIHTRLPVVVPQRIDDECLSWMSESRLKMVVVLHINHANEIDTDIADMVDRLKGAGTLVLNQSVLLKGINDEVNALVALSESLFDVGVLPYYLHLLDKTTGVAHFDCDLKRALGLYKQLQHRLPGFLLPRLVREEPGKESKTPVF